MRKIILLAILCPALSLAQPTKNNGSPGPLTVGDTLPSGALNPKHQTPNAKLLILEFFATWCSSCVKALPLSDSLQKAYNGRLQFILVNTATTGDNEATVRAFFIRHRRRDGTAYNFPYITKDTILHTFFPHTGVPHYVWLSAEGVVLAITTADELTKENIEAALEQKPLRLTVKNDFPAYRPEIPLLWQDNGGTAADLQFSATLTGYLPNLGTGARRHRDSATHRLTILNRSLHSAYQFALGFAANRVVLEGLDTARFFNTGQPAAEWKKRLYCFELTLPATAAPADLRSRLHRFLNATFGLHGRIEKRRVACWVLRYTGKGLPPSRGGRQDLRWGRPEQPLTCLQNAPLSRLVEALNSQLIGLPLLPIIVDESGISYNIDLELAAALTDLPGLKKELARYGLNLFPTERNLDMFVLSASPPAHGHPPPNLPFGNKE